MPTHLDRDSLAKIPEMGEHVATHKQYFSWFSELTKDHIQHNLGLFSRYLNAINKLFSNDDEPHLESIQISGNLADFHPELLNFFYLRLYKRILFALKKHNIESVKYFKDAPPKEDARTKDLVMAIKEEIESAINMHDIKLAADEARRELDEEKINEFKRENHSIHIKKHALPFKITETILGAGTKINSTTKRMDTTNFFQRPPVVGHSNPPHMATLHPPHMLDLVPKSSSGSSPNKQWGISPTSLGFQVTGIVFSGLWLIYNIFSILYHKKKENRNIFSFDNMREAVPSLLFLPLGLVALLTPIGMWISIVFAVHSILDVGYKVYEHVKNRRKINADIAKNAAKIEKLKQGRPIGTDKINANVAAFKRVDLANDADLAKQFSASSEAWLTDHETNNKELLDALTLQDKLIIERANKSNNFAAFSYSTRTIIAVVSAIGLGLTLSMVPPLMFAGSMILVATTCITTLIFIPQIINRFYMHHKINQLKQERMNCYGVNTAELYNQLGTHFSNLRQYKTGDDALADSIEEPTGKPNFMPTDDLNFEEFTSEENKPLMEEDELRTPLHAPA